MKKFICLILIMCLIPLSGCGASENEASDKIQITATLFPQYDFARQIGGDRADVTLLLPAGTESHNFDPSPSDMVTISRSDLFIYTGDSMEPWAGSIASSVGSSVKILDASQNIDLSETENLHEDEETSHSHSTSLDPHIWLDFDNARIMAENIFNALKEISPENEDYFEENFVKLCDAMDKLDKEYTALFLENRDKTVVFGGKFALGYLVRRYNVNYKSAYDSCSSNAEPGISDIALLSEFIKENNIKVVYCEEYTEPKVASTLAQANNAKVLPIHSCHNINKEDREAGVTFIDIMAQNLENLREGFE